MGRIWAARIFQYHRPHPPPKEPLALSAPKAPYHVTIRETPVGPKCLQALGLCFIICTLSPHPAPELRKTAVRVKRAHGATGTKRGFVLTVKPRLPHLLRRRGADKSGDELGGMGCPRPPFRTRVSP